MDIQSVRFITRQQTQFFFIMNNSRGVAYWTDGKDDKRMFYTAGSSIFVSMQ